MFFIVSTRFQAPGLVPLDSFQNAGYSEIFILLELGCGILRTPNPLLVFVLPAPAGEPIKYDYLPLAGPEFK